MLLKDFPQALTSYPKDVANNIIMLLKQKAKADTIIDDALINSLIISTDYKNKLKSIIKKFNTEKNSDNLKTQLLNINGIGEAKAMELLSLNISSLKDLEKKEYFELLPEEAKVHVKYKPLAVIPRSHIVEIESQLKNMLKSKFIIAGSFLRGAETSGDIDILTPDDFDKVLSELAPLKVFVYSKGEDRMSLLIKFKRFVKVDFFRFNKKDFIFQLTYLTGSKKFNILMRRQANKLGYLLNQKGLYKDKTEVPVKNEKELFAILQMEYKTPAQRDI
jgi:DNA polymerase/3'-5' exonuclease PolX